MLGLPGYDPDMTSLTPGTSPTPGWYADASNVVRWWDGRAWTEHVQQPGQSAPTASVQQPVIVNTTQRVRFYKTSHGFHLIMSVVTLGLWLPVWAIMAIANSTRSN